MHRIDRLHLLGRHDKLVALGFFASFGTHFETLSTVARGWNTNHLDKCRLQLMLREKLCNTRAVRNILLSEGAGDGSDLAFATSSM
jgi:hypothetical protein